MTIFAPNASNAAFSFSASSFGTFSFKTCGTLSANFFASMRFIFGTIDLTSRITLAFAAASKDSRRRVKMVFSFGFCIGKGNSETVEQVQGKQKVAYLCHWLFFFCWSGCCRQCRSSRCCWHGNFGDIQSCLHQPKLLSQQNPLNLKCI